MLVALTRLPKARSEASISWKRRAPWITGSSLASSISAPSRITLSVMIMVPARERERPGEVLGRVLLVRVDEDEIERAAGLGGEPGECLERRPEAQLDGV